MATTAQTTIERLHMEIDLVPANRREPLLKIVHAYREAVEDEDAEIDPVESFRQGWKEVQEGKTRPIEGLWKRVGLE